MGRRAKESDWGKHTRKKKNVFMIARWIVASDSVVPALCIHLTVIHRTVLASHSTRRDLSKEDRRD